MAQDAPHGIVVDHEHALDTDPFFFGAVARRPVVRRLCLLPLGLGDLAILELDPLRDDECAGERTHDERPLEHEALVLQRAPLDIVVSHRLVVLDRRFRRKKQVHQAEVEKDVVAQLALELRRRRRADLAIFVRLVVEIEVRRAEQPDDDAHVGQLAREPGVTRDDEELGHVRGARSAWGARGRVGPARFVAEEADPVEQERAERGCCERHDERVRRRWRQQGKDRKERRQRGVVRSEIWVEWG